MTTRLRFAVVTWRRRLVDLLSPLAWSRTVSSRFRQHRPFAELSDHLLRDVGVSRADAQTAAAKSRWEPTR